jgi:hypothetical protein
MLENTRSDEPGNPYAAPSLASMEPEAGGSGTASTRELQAFVGRKASYYLRKWAPLLEGGRRDTGFNWAAFFLSGIWIGYRKMYAVAFIFYGVIALETLVEEIVFVHVLGEEPPAALGRLIPIAIAAICGTCGNGWYLSHARKMIAETKTQGLQDDAFLLALAKRGGTSVLASLGILLLFCATMFLTGFLFETIVSAF